MGCHLEGTFLGAFGYADDVTLLYHSLEGLQVMLNICEEFSESHSMQFSTDPSPSKSKTKCLFFSRSRTPDSIRSVRLNGDSLPWVNSAKHLGNLLSTKLSHSPLAPDMASDVLEKRAMFFDSIHQVLQKFGSFDPKLVMRLIGIYSTSMYGSPLWQLDSSEYQKLVRSWNTAIKMTWNLPYATHTRLLEDLCPVAHLEHTLYSRFISFAQGLYVSNKNPLRLLFRNCVSNLSSVTGNNINFLSEKFKFKSLSQMFLGKEGLKKTRVYNLPSCEKWKLSLIEELALSKKNLLDIDFDEEHLQDLLDYVCTL